MLDRLYDVNGAFVVCCGGMGRATGAMSLRDSVRERDGWTGGTKDCILESRRCCPRETLVLFGPDEEIGRGEVMFKPGQNLFRLRRRKCCDHVPD